MKILKLSVKSPKLRVLTVCLVKTQGTVKNIGEVGTKDKNIRSNSEMH
jgi:hypothetical protein